MWRKNEELGFWYKRIQRGTKGRRIQVTITIHNPIETSPCRVTIPMVTLLASTTGKNWTGEGGDSIFCMASTAIASTLIILGFLQKLTVVGTIWMGLCGGMDGRIIPVAYTAHGKPENCLPACLECSSEVTICKGSNQVVCIVYDQ